MSKTNIIRITLKSLILSLALSNSLIALDSPKHIAITQYVDHVAADAVRQGVLDELKQHAFIEGKNLKVTYENAQGSAATASQIAHKFVSLKPDVIVTITTPSSQAMVAIAKGTKLPILFSAVTDPVSAGLVKSLSHPEGFVTGVRDAPPIQEQFEFMKTLLPAAKTIGILYNPGDPGSLASLETIKEQAKSQDFILVEATPTKSADIQAAFLKLVGKVDAIYVPLDNMVVSAMKTVSALALKHDLPLFSASSGSVQEGAFACLGYSYAQTGHQTGKLVLEIFQGKTPQDIPVATPGNTELFVNRKALEKLKLTLPDNILKNAHFY